MFTWIIYAHMQPRLGACDHCLSSSSENAHKNKYFREEVHKSKYILQKIQLTKLYICSIWRHDSAIFEHTDLILDWTWLTNWGSICHNVNNTRQKSRRWYGDVFSVFTTVSDKTPARKEQQCSGNEISVV